MLYDDMLLRVGDIREELNKQYEMYCNFYQGSTATGIEISKEVINRLAEKSSIELIGVDVAHTDDVCWNKRIIVRKVDNK